MDTIRIKRREVAELIAGLDQITAVMKGTEFRIVYALKRSRDNLKNEFEAIQEAQKPSKEFETFDNERMALCKEYALSDNGEPKTQVIGGAESYVLDPLRRREFDAKCNDLRLRHGKTLKAEEQRMREMPAFMAEDVDVQVHRISADVLTTSRQYSDVPVQALIWAMPLISDAERFDDAATPPAERDEPKPRVMRAK